VPFEVKNQDAEITPKRLKGLRQLIEGRGVEHAYLREDFGLLPVESLQPGGERDVLAAPRAENPGAAGVLLVIGAERPPITT
jgi:hypothetical protein